MSCLLSGLMLSIPLCYKGCFMFQLIITLWNSVFPYVPCNKMPQFSQCKTNSSDCPLSWLTTTQRREHDKLRQSRNHGTKHKHPSQDRFTASCGAHWPISHLGICDLVLETEPATKHHSTVLLVTRWTSGLFIICKFQFSLEMYS